MLEPRTLDSLDSLLSSLLFCYSPIRDIGGNLTTDVELLAQHVVPALGLDTGRYSPVFRELVQYWANLGMHENGYVIHAMQVLKELDKRAMIKQDEWLEVGKYLADATKRTYGNGSHSFITKAVPAIARSPKIQTKEQFRDAVEGLLNVVEPLREIGVNGGIVYGKVAPILEIHGHLSPSQFKNYFLI